ncbi:MAG: hypothetical protein ABFS46_20950 [Myxococcota bacterium]
MPTTRPLLLAALLLGPACSLDRAQTQAHLDRAEAYAAEGAHAEAVIELKTALAMEPLDLAPTAAERFSRLSLQTSVGKTE